MGRPPPQLIGGGIDPSNYIYKKVSLAGHSIRLNPGYIFEESVPSPGIYYIQSIINPGGSNIGNVTSMAEVLLQLTSDASYYCSKYKATSNTSYCYTVFDVCGILPIKSTVSSKIFLSTSNVTKTFSSKAQYIFIALKLCDLPKEDYI